ncbi:MAG: J domain-containing protein [Bacteroidetes bacterium]|nr:J domain-containing protein [Bacteroidota bacterium]
MNPSRDYYQILGITPTASNPDIKKAFRRLALVHHPDTSRNPDLSAAIFALVQEAYQVLSDPHERVRYHYARHLLHPQPATKPLAISAEEVEELAQKLYRGTRQQDPFRLNRDQLFLQVMDLLSDHNLALLRQQADPSLLDTFLNLVFGASRELSKAQSDTVFDRLHPLARQYPLTAGGFKKKRKEYRQYHFWNRYKMLLALAIALVFCLALYLFVRK